jgi:hypothetical protein
MIEGANYNFIKPDFDFARYLPKEVPLTRQEHDRYVSRLGLHPQVKLYLTSNYSIHLIVLSICFSNSLLHGVYASFLNSSFAICIALSQSLKRRATHQADHL